ncbi:uncharacterized protein LOC144445284 [Glandiceps talaboti]
MLVDLFFRGQEAFRTERVHTVHRTNSGGFQETSQRCPKSRRFQDRFRTSLCLHGLQTTSGNGAEKNDSRTERWKRRSAEQEQDIAPKRHLGCKQALSEVPVTETQKDLSDSDSVSGVGPTNQSESNPCHCKKCTVLKVSTSTQTDPIPDKETVQHDHCYSFAPTKPGSRKRKKQMPMSSTPKKKTARVLLPEFECDTAESDAYTTDSEVGSDDDDDDDTSYDADLSSYSIESCYTDLDESMHTGDDGKNPVFLVYKSSLDKLFEKCQECGSFVHVQRTYRGTMVVYNWTCLNSHSGRWESQPMLRNMPLGNLELSGSILFAGGTYQKIFDIAKTFNLNILSERHFMNIQRTYLFPVIQNLYDYEHNVLIDALRFQHVFVSGDGRSDSPGHCAKYLSYSFMEEETDLILHFELVQVTEAPGEASTNMERVAFNRGLTYLDEQDVKVDGMITDRHPQISCDMNTLYPSMSHEYDVFHVAKNVDKKLRQKAKTKGCEDVGPWRPSIVNHFWWCCASCNGDYEMLKDMWISVLHHVCNIHEWASAERFHKCLHGKLSLEDETETSWLKPDSPPHNAIRAIILDKKLLKDMKKMVLFKHTGNLEVFHGMLLKYCPKRDHFSYEGMRARLQLAVLDHNENVGREQATTKDGTLQFGLSYPKRKGEWVVKKMYKDKTYNFRQQLMDMILSRREDNSVILGKHYVTNPDLPKNIAHSDRPYAKDVADNYTTRFRLN